MPLHVNIPAAPLQTQTELVPTIVTIHPLVCLNSSCENPCHKCLPNIIQYIGKAPQRLQKHHGIAPILFYTFLSTFFLFGRVSCSASCWIVVSKAPWHLGELLKNQDRLTAKSIMFWIIHKLKLFTRHIFRICDAQWPYTTLG